MGLKAAELAVKFTYMVFSKQKRQAPCDSWPRIVAPPSKIGGSVEMRLCTSQGKTIYAAVVRKHAGKEAYAAARKSKWGDTWPFAFKELIKPLRKA